MSQNLLFAAVVIGAFRVNSLPTRYFFYFFCCLLIFFKINFFKKILSGIYYQSVKQFGSRIRPDNMWSLYSGSRQTCLQKIADDIREAKCFIMAGYLLQNTVFLKYEIYF